MFRLLITGSRYLKDCEFVWMPLWHMIHKHESMIVVHGDCPTGADKFAKDWVYLDGQQWNQSSPRSTVERLVLAEAYPAQWNVRGKAAGPIRNQQMVNLGADSCFAFPTAESRGTYDCMARAFSAGIPVYEWSTTDLGRYHRITDDEGNALVERFLR